MAYKSGRDPRGEMDLLSEYRRLKQKADEATTEVVRAEERLESAKKSAQEVALRAKEMGFESAEALRMRCEALENDLAEKIAALTEAVS